MDKIGIIGLGLIGGSLAKALKRREDYYIIAHDIDEASLTHALAEKIIDEYSLEVDEAFSDARLIFICTPVEKICGFIEKLLPINKDVLLTDVGSTKSNIFHQIEKFENIRFIGGHPMAGSEKTGYAAAKNFLFENAYYVLTPTKNISRSDFDYLENIVKLIGAIPIVVRPELHDFIVSAISHLPHVIAASLVNCVHALETEDNLIHRLAAGGFKDITRIASSSPNIWNSICVDNKDEILKVMYQFKCELDKFENQLLSGDVYEFFESSKNYRDSFANSKKTGVFSFFELKVDVLDRPGSIATIATMLSVNSINIKNIGIINNREFENGIMSISFENQKDIDKGRELLKEMNYTVYG